MGQTPYRSVNSLLELAGVAGPYGPPIDWPSVQRAIGSVLPCDYKALVDLAGSIYVGQFLGTFTPGSPNPNVDLLVQMGARLSALQEMKRVGGSQECPYPLWFEPGGLLPWGATDNGDTLFWLTRGHPDQWTVVVGEGRGPLFDEFPLCASDFLVEFLEGRLASDILPDDAGPRSVVAHVDRALPLA